MGFRISDVYHVNIAYLIIIISGPYCSLSIQLNIILSYITLLSILILTTPLAVLLGCSHLQAHVIGHTFCVGLSQVLEAIYSCNQTECRIIVYKLYSMLRQW